MKLITLLSIIILTEFVSAAEYCDLMLNQNKVAKVLILEEEFTLIDDPEFIEKKLKQISVRKLLINGNRVGNGIISNNYPQFDESEFNSSHQSRWKLRQEIFTIECRLF